MRMRYITAGVALAFSATAFAAEPTQCPAGRRVCARIAETPSYDSNPLRLTSRPQEIWGSTTTAQLLLRSRSPRNIVESNTTIDQNLFNRSAFNSTDMHQKLRFGRDTLQWGAALDAGYDLETTRTAELTNYAHRSPRVSRTKYSVAPSLTYRNSQRSNYTLRSYYNQISYDDSSFSDYELYGASLGTTYQLDTTNSVSFAVKANRYTSLQSASLTSDSYGPSLSVTSKLTPRLSSTISVGTEHTEKSGSSSNSTDNGWNYVFQASADYRGNVDRAKVSAMRAREPFGNGTETLLTTLQLQEKHALTPTLDLTGEIIYRTADYSTEPGVNLDDSTSAAAGIEYAMNERTQLAFNYRYLNEHYIHQAGDAQSHQVMLGMNHLFDWN